MTESALRAGRLSATATPSTSLTEAHRRLCEVEQQSDLLRFTIDGWTAWPLLRFEVSRLLAGIAFPSAQGFSRGARAVQALGDIASLARLKRARHLVQTYSSGLREVTGNRYRDVWFDDVILSAGSTFKIEVANNPGFTAHSRRALVTRDLSTAVVDIAAGIIARRCRSPAVDAVARSITEVLRQELGLRTLDDEWVNRRLLRFLGQKRVYSAILGRVRPSFVLVADFGAYGLVAAAKERGSVVLELQHGVNDRSHAGYSWSAYAGSRRSSMPLPDRLLLYGEHWRRELADGAFWGDSLRVVGSPRIDRWRALPPIRVDSVCTVLVTTQGLEVESLTFFLREFLEQVGEGQVEMVIKLHPLYDQDREPYLHRLSAFMHCVTVQASDEGASTFEWLRRAHLHVSISSASHYDAIALGVPTVILPFQTHDVVLSLYHAGHASLARTPGELAALALGWRDLRLPTDVSQHYFRADACRNILRELELPVGKKPD